VSKRKRSVKKTASRPTRPTRARARKRARVTAAVVARLGYVELRPIRTKLQADVETLGAAINQSTVARPELEEALKRMSRFLADINDICGSNMSLPIS
jgi:hypothetical protein